MCKHSHTITDTTGSMHEGGGSPWDDYKERVICLDCHEEVTDPVTAKTEPEPEVNF